MTSTRNNNTLLDYKLNSNRNNLYNNYSFYNHSSNGKPYTECIPSLGYTPSHMSRDTFSNNPIDIESSLFGIGSTNLVEPQEPITPLLKNPEFKDFFKKDNVVIMPNPLITRVNRPFPI